MDENENEKSENTYGVRGQRLWESLLESDSALADESNANREVAITACRTADRLERMEALAKDAPPVLYAASGNPVNNPLLVEVRNQSALLMRLIGVLRLPDARGNRPIRRATIQAVNKPQVLSSLDRARLAKSS